MFVDQVTIKLSAGKGGNGIVAWIREKFIPKGGPAGGDGGNGGSIILKANPQIYSLEHLRNIRKIQAMNGQIGGSQNCKGKTGKDYTLELPLGTLVKDAHTKEILYDLTEKDEVHLICKGGKGGKGNVFFKSATNQAPNKCTEGKPGQSIEVEFELKLIADIGLVGMPNAGKSTLISKITLLPVKIAPYPFTTLRPNLGILEFEDYKRAMIADIPGIIENAHLNKGLGLSFLRHIERTKVLIFVIDISTEDPVHDFSMLRKELKSYSKEMEEKPFFVVLNKIDVENTEESIKIFKKNYPFDLDTLIEISAKESLNLDKLKSYIQKNLFENSERSKMTTDVIKDFSYQI